MTKPYHIAPKTGYKVVWAPHAAPGQMLSLRALRGPQAGVIEYHSGREIRPRSHAGPLHVAATLPAAEAAASHFRDIWKRGGEVQIWRVAWKPWRTRLPRTRAILNRFGEPAAAAGWAYVEQIKRGVCMLARFLPKGTRLARSVVLQERVK